MSTDDFEARLRTRLVDLADAEDDWADPLPEARRRAATGDRGEPVAAVTALPHRRRWLPGLAVAATVAALLVGGGFGVRELVRTSQTATSGSAGSALGGADYAGSCAIKAPCDAGTAPVPSVEQSGPASAGTSSAATSTGIDTAGCAVTRQAASNGALADVASIRPSGITGSKASAGGSASVGYQLTFTRSGGSAQIRAAQAVWTNAGVLCGAPPGEVQSNAIQVVPVEPGAGISGAATFTAVDSSGNPLPAGTYEVSIVIPYTTASSGDTASSYLVSPPTSVVVS